MNRNVPHKAQIFECLVIRECHYLKRLGVALLEEGVDFRVSEAQARSSDSIFPMLVDLNIELSFFLYHNVFAHATMLPSHDDNELNL